MARHGSFQFSALRSFIRSPGPGSAAAGKTASAACGRSSPASAVAAAGPPGEPLVEGVQARIGVGQVAFDAAEDPQLTPAQAHDGMLPCGCGSLLLRG